MKEYTCEEAIFSDSIKITETTDPAHADNINDAPKQLLQNTLVLKKKLEDVEKQTGEIVGNDSQDAFSEEKDYKAGAYCIYEDVLYIFISDKEPGEWDPAAVQATNVLEELRRQNATIDRLIDWAKTVDADLPYSATVEKQSEGENHFKFLTSMRSFYQSDVTESSAKVGDV